MKTGFAARLFGAEWVILVRFPLCKNARDFAAGVNLLDLWRHFNPDDAQVPTVGYPSIVPQQTCNGQRGGRVSSIRVP
jgi:hypothetical protein